MACDEVSAARVREYFAHHPGMVAKKMFGGLGFLLHGNMCVGLWKEFLILRLGPAAEEALETEFVREFDITGKPMRGWVMIEPEGYDDDADLRTWLEQAVEFVVTLPAKAAAGPRRPMTRKKSAQASPRTKRRKK